MTSFFMDGNEGTFFLLNITFIHFFLYLSSGGVVILSNFLFRFMNKERSYKMEKWTCPFVSAAVNLSLCTQEKYVLNWPYRADLKKKCSVIEKQIDSEVKAAVSRSLVYKKLALLYLDRNSRANSFSTQ